MNLIRLIVFGLIFWMIYRTVQRLVNKPDLPQKKPPPRVKATDMVRCAHCGMHIPKNESFQKDGRDYCSEEHRDAGPSD